VKHFITGQVVKALDEEMIAQVGNAMGRLHQIPAPQFLPEQHAYGLETFHGIIGQGIDAAYENWLEQQVDVLRRKIPTGLPRGLIHGDVFSDNVLFEGDVLQAVIDFEEACSQPYVFDLGMAVVGLCTQDGEIRLPKARPLIAGYQQARKLERAEQGALQAFVQYAAAATSSWRFWKYNIHTPTPEKSKDHQEMVEVARNASAISPEAFSKLVFL
jgi:homoserine kinase type II